MNARRKSFHGPTSTVGQPQYTEGHQEEEETVVDLAKTRAEWVQDKQAELDRVYDTHDSLIREAFHLEKFVSLLTFDPKVAKEDRSDVFQRFQAQYDLVDHTSSAGPSRRTTRRAHTERLQVLKVHTPSVPATPTKRPRKAEDSPGPSAAFWDIKAKAKSKGKQVHGDLSDTTSPQVSYGRKGKHGEVAAEPILSMLKSKSTKHGAVANEQTAQHDTSSLADGLAQPPPRKKRRLTHDTSSPRHTLRSAASMSDLTAYAGPVNALSFRPPKAAFAITPQPPLSPVKHPVTRVKLIVRKPPTILSNPEQKPKPPLFGGSVDALLTSFIYRYDREANQDEIDAELTEELGLWRRVDHLRRKGRFLDRSSYTFVGAPPKDAWAGIVAEIERPGPRLVDAREMAANVAGKVLKYWEGENKAEEARMRSVARQTLHFVIAQWKKAVYHVREQARLQWEAEERRRGQEHLNAILDQSGHILSVQLHDLARESRSRSRSVSTHGRERTHADSGGEQEQEGANASDEEKSGSSEDSSDSESTAEDEGIAMLVPDLEIESASQAGRSPRSASMEVDMDLETASSEGGDNDRRHASPTLLQSPVLSAADVSRVLDNTPPPFPAIQYASRLPVSMDIDHELPLPSAQELNGRHDPGKSPFRVNSDGSRSLDLHLHISPRSLKTRVLSPEPITSEIPLPMSDADIGTPILHASEGILCTPITEIPEAPSDEAMPAVDEDIEDEVEEDLSIPYYLRPYAVAPVQWDPTSKIKPPLLLRGTLRPYQQGGLEWLASIHTRNLNGILADEMGLGKTIQTIALLAHLACDRGIWGPHLIIVPTSVLLNWEMELKKFLPGFNVLSYHGNTKQRKELRQGWNNKYSFNVCVTSYTLASRDSHVFKRKRWYYMILDEAHMIKNFKSQRWNTLLLFRSFRRLLLTGTPLQNNLTELWALLQFLMSGTDFANLKEFGEWFSNPLEKAIELGAIDDETQQRVSKLHAVLRPYLLRRLKRDVEKELPQKYEHIVMCHLSKRQRFLYDEFMSRAETRHDLQSGVYQKIANILMQLRKVVNHPDLFEIRPIVTSFAMRRSAVADFEIKELLVRRRLLMKNDEDQLNFEFLGLSFVGFQGASEIAARETRRLDGTNFLPMITELPGEPPPRDTRTVTGFKTYRTYQQRAAAIARWTQIGYINCLRCSRLPVYSGETLALVQRCYDPLVPPGVRVRPALYLSTPTVAQSAIKSYIDRAEEMASTIDHFTFATPSVVARDLPSIALAGLPPEAAETMKDPQFDAPLHRASVKLQIAFPDPSLLQYDCGKLQVLDKLLRERKAGGHRILIFTQMTRILDILETFLNFHGYLYLRLDGATKIEDRQYITERFNSDSRIFCFISSSRSGGVGINLTGADTVIFYDSDFNPQMDRQCEDRAHRIGQIRDVHIYRFVSQYTVEEALLRKANQKRSLDDLVIQKGEFDWRTLFTATTEGALTHALGEFEDVEDAQAAQLAAREEMQLENEDAQEFGNEKDLGATGEARIARPGQQQREVDVQQHSRLPEETEGTMMDVPAGAVSADAVDEGPDEDEDGDGEEGRTIDDYMIDLVHFDSEFFADWNV